MFSLLKKRKLKQILSQITYWTQKHRMLEYIIEKWKATLPELSSVWHSTAVSTKISEINTKYMRPNWFEIEQRYWKDVIRDWIKLRTSFYEIVIK